VQYRGRGGRNHACRTLEVGGEVSQPLIEALSAYQLHAEVMLVLVLAHFVNRNDVGVVKLSDRFSFVLKSSTLVIRGQSSGFDHLQGHEPVEAELPGLVDDSHTAFAKNS